MNFKEFISQYNKIVIPRLQRDYAQGRYDTHTNEIRKALLYDIFTKENISLNVIFGECIKDSQETLPIFLPVDGQQRLTTLFLLYIYDWKINNNPINGLNKFTYETRHSTTEFIEQLIMNNWPILEIKKIGNVGDAIKNQGWFVWPWEEDPSVQGMLRMLDAIHEMRKIYPFPNLDRINFDFLDMGSLDLNETLYLKMNSRGKKLSDFEKIKSALDNVINNCNEISVDDAFFSNSIRLVKTDSFAEYWRWEMERNWSDWFWSKERHQMDDNFLNLIRAFSIAFYANITQFETTTNGERIEDEKSKRLANERLSWSAIKAIWEKADEKMKIVEDPNVMNTYCHELAKLLNRLVLVSGKFESVWKSLSINMKELSSSEKQKEIALLWAISQFRGDSFKSVEFENWLRFSCNIINNYVDGFDSFARFIKQCSEIYSKHSTYILLWLVSKESKDIERFAQWEEERIKAQCLLNNNSVGQVVLESEAHPLLEGRIRPLLLSADCVIDEQGLPDRWRVFRGKFDENGAINNATCVEAMRVTFSYLKFESLYWNKYVFQNTRDVWKNNLLRDEYKIGFSKFINGKEALIHPITEKIGVLCAPGVLEKVIDLNNRFFIRDPEFSLRPNGDKWNGIRLYQDHILKSVRSLLKIPGLDFENNEVRLFYENHDFQLVWGVRLKFIYKGFTLQLEEDCRLYIYTTPPGYLNDENETNVYLYNYKENLWELLDAFIEKALSLQ